MITAAVVTDAELSAVALTRVEYELACTRLGRVPNQVELGMIAAMWSEHCGYKSSKPLLQSLPTSGPAVLQGPGENAGVVDIGGGLAAVFKIESHNHPSAVEPYQGAATGVGGILRDIFAMGARPIAILDSLRFGNDRTSDQRRLLEGVVSGIGGYGNCIGVPTVGGEIYFDDSYERNCLVNAMCVGVVATKNLMHATARNAGDVVLLVGADTGRDGIHGATFASADLQLESQSNRPSVQVANPFLEKCLMEACLDLAGDSRVSAVQDLGAAGLTSSCAELAHRGGLGIEIDVGRVSRREAGMTPYEVMLSESQERMLLVVSPESVPGITAHFARWDLHSDVIGEITEGGHFVVRDGELMAADLPLGLLIDEVPLRQLPSEPLAGSPRRAGGEEPPPPGIDAGAALLDLLGSPNIGSREPIFRRYDHQVGNDTVVRPGRGDAAVVRIRGNGTALAICTDGNARYARTDPKLAAAAAVCEAARNVSATGAVPLGLTNCLNFGNPEDPRVYWQLEQAVMGLKEACDVLGIPVVSGNVSLYNQSRGLAIIPTVVVGMVGLIAAPEMACTMGFSAAGDQIAVAGPLAAQPGGSEFSRLFPAFDHGGLPVLDLEMERRVLQFVRQAIAERLLHSAHDVSDGGLAVAIAESCLAGNVGAGIDLPGKDCGLLFGEDASRFVVSFPDFAGPRLAEMAAALQVPWQRIGEAGGSRLTIGDEISLSLPEMNQRYSHALA